MLITFTREIICSITKRVNTVYKNLIPSKTIYFFSFVAGPEAATVGEQGRKYKTWSVGKAASQKQASDSGLGQATLRQCTHAHREAKSDGAASLPLVSKAHPGLTPSSEDTRLLDKEDTRAPSGQITPWSSTSSLDLLPFRWTVYSWVMMVLPSVSWIDSLISPSLD